MLARKGHFIFAALMGLVGAVLVFVYVSGVEDRARARHSSQDEGRSREQSLAAERIKEIRDGLKPDETVYALEVDRETALEPWISAGDRVDLYAAGGRGSAAAVVEDALIVAIRGSQKPYDEYGEYVKHRHVDLVLPKDAIPGVIEAARSGKVDFVLRTPAEQADTTDETAEAPKEGDEG